jgi:hypothetical protein
MGKKPDITRATDLDRMDRLRTIDVQSAIAGQGEQVGDGTDLRGLCDT